MKNFGLENDGHPLKKKKKSENEMIILVHTESECLQVAS